MEQQRAPTTGAGAPPPPELTSVLGPHLVKIRPWMKSPPKTELAVYALTIEGARLDGAGKVVTTGNGTFSGPFNSSTREMLYSVYPRHMPALRDRIESTAAKKILIVSCELTTGDGDSAAKKVHCAVIGFSQ